MESDILIVKTVDYRRWNGLSEDSYAFESTYYFDKECGLKYISNVGDGSGLFMFKIVDKQRWMLAKIKYGI
jgi:hypothetical protein